MTNVFHVAKYILDRTGKMSTMKIHKLLYYAQAWSLVWDDAPLFEDRIEAWVGGPVICALFEKHRGLFEVTPKMFVKFSKNTLTPTQSETIDVVLRDYGQRSSQWLSDQTHVEDPWRDARKGLRDSERGCQEITQEALKKYYSSLQ